MRPEPRGEFERIAAIVAGLPPGERVVLGPGDDAAIVRPAEGCDLVVTTDAFVEGRHWREGLLPPEGVGRRLAAANLSDVAAMGARPLWAAVACGVPAGADEGALRAIEHACAAALAAEGAAIVGGNLTATEGPRWFAVTLIGEVERGAAFTRAGARAGDVLAVTGVPGRSAATLAIALGPGDAVRGTNVTMAHVPPALAAWYAAPPCRVRPARAMAHAGGVHACIDVSDGLAGDLAHLCEASGVSARLETAGLPDDPALHAAAEILRQREPGLDAAAIRLAWMLGASDDYELLLAIEPERFEACRAAASAAGATLTRIGEVLSRSAAPVLLRDASGSERPLSARGYDHFA